MIELIPAIDLINGQCVRLTKGDYDQKKVYNDNPAEVAKDFEKLGFKRLHVVDLDGAKSKQRQRAESHLVSHFANCRFRRRNQDRGRHREGIRCRSQYGNRRQHRRYQSRPLYGVDR